MYKTLIIAFLCLLSMMVHGQVDSVHMHDYGCHMVKSRIAGIRYTAEELEWARASKERSDTFEIIHYTIHLDVTDFSGGTLEGWCDVDFVPKMDGLSHINLDLEQLVVDNVESGGMGLDFRHEGPLLQCLFDQELVMGDTVRLRVHYGGTPMTSESGFGGFYFESGYAYNLGIGLDDKPHNYGRAWYPCFDNFVERSTYEYQITHRDDHTAHGVGTYMGTDTLPDGKLLTTYYMSQPIPTYLSSIAVSNYTTLDYIHEGIYGEVPIRLIARPNQLANMEQSLENMGVAVDAFEYWFGPHIWERVGYVLTSRGAMEHPTNVAYPAFSVAGGNKNERLMAHELAHMWWGNIMTLKTSHDMWIKEANAEYGSHLFTEYAYGHDEFINQVKTNAFNIVRAAHINDGEYLALSPMPEDKTYSEHTYRKGALVIHNLRTYLGDTLFASGMRQLLEDNFYSAINAFDFREQLSASTGYDLTAYFDDWIFGKGYPTFEVDSMDVEEVGAGYLCHLYIEQKLRGTDQYFTNVPIEISFWGADGSRYYHTVYMGGEWTEVDIEVPFRPQHVVLNEFNKLNLGFYGNTVEVNETRNFAFPHANFNLNVNELTEPATIRIDQYFVGADPIDDPQVEGRLSQNRHWRVYGDLSETNVIRGRLSYSGGAETEGDLVSITEDSIILAWRPDARSPWLEHPDYEKLQLPAQGIGQMWIHTLLPGEYAFANGPLELATITKEVENGQLTIYPNPAHHQLHIEGLGFRGDVRLAVYDMDGRPVLSEKQRVETVNTLNISRLVPGAYMLYADSSEGVGSSLRKMFVIE